MSAVRARRRLAAEVAILLAMGVTFSILGPFGSERLENLRRYPYWVFIIVGGGLIGIGIDHLLGRWLRPGWRRVIAVTAVMTPPVTLFVLIASHLILGQPASLLGYSRLFGQVFAIWLPVMTVRALAWRRPGVRIETRTVVEPPMPEAEAAFRRRLSAKRRAARLIAVEAHDHYLRVHTDAGDELIMATFADAMDDLAKAHGYRVHRSWWIAADAIETAHWKRGRGHVTLAGDLSAPVSRSGAPVLKAAGWL